MSDEKKARIREYQKEYLKNIKKIIIKLKSLNM